MRLKFLNKKLISMFSILAVLLLSVTVFADGINNVTTENEEAGIRIFVSGSIGEENPSENISVRVYKKDKNQQNLETETLKDALYYASQVKSDNLGNFAFDYLQQGDKGIYKIQINYHGLSETDKSVYNFVYLPEVEKNEFLGYLNDRHIQAENNLSEQEILMKSGELQAKIESFINNGYIIVDSYDSSFEGKSEVFKLMLYNEDYKEISDVSMAFEKALLLHKINSQINSAGLEELLSVASVLFEFSENPAWLLYQNSDVVFDREAIDSKILNADLKTQTQFTDMLVKEIVAVGVASQGKLTALAVLRSLNSILSIDFTAFDSISSSDKKTQIIGEFVDNVQSDMSNENIKMLFERTVSNKSKSGTSSSSSSGGGAAPKVSTAIAAPITPKPVVQAKGNQMFSDLDSVEWARTAIEELAIKGYISGVGEGKFEPQRNITRAEFTKIIMEAAGLIENAYCDFDDVDIEAWYGKAVASAYKNKIVLGKTDNLFGVSDSITRQDMVCILYRLLLLKNVQMKTSETVFSDDNDISEYAKEAIYKLYESSVINGVTETEFKPLSTASRAEAAKCINEALKYLEK